MKLLTIAVGLMMSVVGFGQVNVTSTLFNQWNASMSALTQVSLINSDLTAHRVKLNVSLKLGSGKSILSAETNEFMVNPGAIILSGVSLSQINSVDGPEISSMKTMGILPYGDYQYCVKVIQNGVEVLDDYCESIQSDYTEYLNLVYPFDTDTISTYLPVLSWMNSTGKVYCTENMDYTIRLARINSGQSPTEALNNNQIQWGMNCLNAFQSNYPVSALKLEDGVSYAWQVQQRNNGAVVNASEIWSFTVKITPDRRDLKYVHVQKGSNPSFISVFEKLYVRFDDSYSQGEINYRLLDKDGQPLSIGIETDSRNLSGVATCSGFNTYEVDVTQYGLPKGYYTVALYNSKNEEYLLKIQVQ